MSCLDNPANSDILEWLPDGDGFLIKDKKRFGSEILPQVLKQTQYSSFTRRMNRWQFKLNNLGHKQASYRHPLFQRGRKDLAMQMAPIRQKQYGGDRRSSGNNNTLKPISYAEDTDDTEKAKRNRVDSIQNPDDSSSGEEDDDMEDNYKMNREIEPDPSEEDQQKMESKASSPLAATATHHRSGDHTSHRYNPQSNLAAYNVPSQSMMQPPPIQNAPSSQRMDNPYNHTMSYPMNMQPSMHHIHMRPIPNANIPIHPSMPYHMQQSSFMEETQQSSFPHAQQQQYQYPFQQQQQQQKQHQQQQSYSWMHQQPMSMPPPQPPPSSSTSSFPRLTQSHQISSDASFQHTQQNMPTNTTPLAPMTMSQPSHYHQGHSSFPQPPPTMPVMTAPNQDSESHSQDLIEYHQKLIDYFSQYQSFLSNDMEISKQALEHLKNTVASSENETMDKR